MKDNQPYLNPTAAPMRTHSTHERDDPGVFKVVEFIVFSCTVAPIKQFQNKKKLVHFHKMNRQENFMQIFYASFQKHFFVKKTKFFYSAIFLSTESTTAILFCAVFTET